MCANIFTKKEVESLLKVSVNTVNSLIASKKLEHFKVNGKVRVSEDQIKNYLNSVEVTPLS
ncbi:MAG: helix-turn-helix domain-containing protein [Campylobacterales bacterium]|nr:helix-turn-helix domain-containing protein [Campylobacterales bacterium]